MNLQSIYSWWIQVQCLPVIWQRATLKVFRALFSPHFSPKEKVFVSENKEKEKRMSVIWTQREGRCGRCRSKTWGNLSPSLISWNVFPSLLQVSLAQMLLVFLIRLLHLSYRQAGWEGRCCVRIRAIPSGMSWFHELQAISSSKFQECP